MKPAICLVAGMSGSGKTTLIERLIPLLAAWGLPVATAKHHRGSVEVDRPGKDSWRHRRAGARATFLVTDGELTVFVSRAAPPTPDELAALCPPEVRLLLVEGFKGLTGYPRVEIVRSGLGRDVPWEEEILCVATDVEGFEAPCPVFRLDDAEGVASELVRRFA